jgi:predicted N-acetyltransferase YhbS
MPPLMTVDSTTIRTLRPEEMALTRSLADEEGWNVGTTDAEALYDADPEGALCAECGGEVVGCLLAAATGGSHGFLGRYLVRKGFRGRGIGSRLWAAGLAHLEAAGATTIGLNAVLKMAPRYAEDGFVKAHRNARYSDKSPAPESVPEGLVPLACVPFDTLRRYDESVFGFPRERLLAAWLAMPRARGLAAMEGSLLRGFGMIRPCRSGWKAGPLFADNPETAARLHDGLRAGLPPGTPVFLEVPLDNPDAVKFVSERGMRRLFENVRMYRGTPPSRTGNGEYSGLSTELG